MQCFGSVLVRLTEPLGSAEPPNLTEPLSSAEPEPVPERFGLPLAHVICASWFRFKKAKQSLSTYSTNDAKGLLEIEDELQCTYTTSRGKKQTRFLAQKRLT